MQAPAPDLARLRPLTVLLRAKAESDRRNYGAKNELLRRLLSQAPDKFVIDSDDGRILGLTHPSTGFRIHMPRSAVPDGLDLRRQPGVAKAASAWDVRGELESLLDGSGDLLLTLKAAAAALPPTRDGYTLWYGPDDGELRLHCCPEDAAALAVPMMKYADVVMTEDREPLERFALPWCLVKRSYSPAMRGVTDALALSNGPANAWYGGPRPVAATLLGGLAGAGIGYGAGAIGEQLGGGYLEKGKLRRTLAMLGAGVGAAPGLGWGAYNTARLGGKGFFSAYPHGGPDADPTPEKEPFEQVFGTEKQNAARLANPENYFARAVKEAFAGGEMVDRVPVDEFNQVIWSDHDPFTPPGLRAAAVGLVESAALSRGGSPFVTPADIARIGIGMGSGYVAGNLVGKTLGALAGLPAEAQQSLQQAGTWAGALKAVLPLAFGR